MDESKEMMIKNLIKQKGIIRKNKNENQSEKQREAKETKAFFSLLKQNSIKSFTIITIPIYPFVCPIIYTHTSERLMNCCEIYERKKKKKLFDFTMVKWFRKRF